MFDDLREVPTASCLPPSQIRPRWRARTIEILNNRPKSRLFIRLGLVVTPEITPSWQPLISPMFAVSKQLHLALLRGPSPHMIPLLRQEHFSLGRYTDLPSSPATLPYAKPVRRWTHNPPE